MTKLYLSFIFVFLCDDLINILIGTHRTLATHLRDRDKERDYYRHEEAVQEFQALLTGECIIKFCVSQLFR